MAKDKLRNTIHSELTREEEPLRGQNLIVSYVKSKEDIHNSNQVDQRKRRGQNSRFFLCVNRNLTSKQMKQFKINLMQTENK